MFIGRGLTQDKPVPTSSLILIIKPNVSDQSNEVEILNYEGTNEDIAQVFANISSNIKVENKLVKQQMLLDNVANWNFIKMNKVTYDFNSLYKTSSDDLNLYYDHIASAYNFNSNFYFDGGYSFKEDDLLLTPNDDGVYYGCPHLNKQYYTIKQMNGYFPNVRGKKSKRSINLRQANQGYHLLDSKYKIVWSTKNAQRFHFTERHAVWSNIRLSGIGSNNYDEIMYLFALLNSKLTFSILNHLVKIENEKDFLLPIKTIKEFVRVPRINEANLTIKKEIIAKANEMITLENTTMLDYADFSKILMQKYDSIIVQDGFLVLSQNNQQVRLKLRGDYQLVSSAVEKYVNSKRSLLEKYEVNLSDIKNIEIIDFEKQRALKDYIDDLVFALYFSVPIKDVSLNKASDIHEVCTHNTYYHLL